MAAYRPTPKPFRKRLVHAITRRLDPPPPSDAARSFAINDSVLVRDSFLDDNEFVQLQHWAYNLETPFTREQCNWTDTAILDFAEARSSGNWTTEQNDIPQVLQVFIRRLEEARIANSGDVLQLGVYRWERLSGISVHQDSFSDAALTFYLNDVWHPNWGGEFTFFESPEHLERGFGQAVSPRRNRLLVNHSNVNHKVSYCSTTAQDRVTLQGFIYRR